MDKFPENLSQCGGEFSGNSWDHSISLSLKGFQHDATDARDHVYGLLGLTGMNVIPDYTRTTQEVIFDYVRAIIKSNTASDSALCFLDTASKGLHNTTEISDLPSRSPSRSNYKLCRADRPCHATRGVFQGDDILEPRIEGHSLFTGGCRIQQIKRFIAIPVVNAPGRAEGETWCDILENLAKGARSTYHTGCPMPRALWATLMRKTDGAVEMSPFLTYFRKNDTTGHQSPWEESMVQQFPGLWVNLLEDRQRLRGPCWNECRALWSCSRQRQDTLGWDQRAALSRMRYAC